MAVSVPSSDFQRSQNVNSSCLTRKFGHKFTVVVFGVSVSVTRSFCIRYFSMSYLGQNTIKHFLGNFIGNSALLGLVIIYCQPKVLLSSTKYILYITADYSLVEIQQLAYQGAVKRVERDILHFFLVSLKFAVGYTKLYSSAEKKMKMKIIM